MDGNLNWRLACWSHYNPTFGKREWSVVHFPPQTGDKMRHLCAGCGNNSLKVKWRCTWFHHLHSKASFEKTSHATVWTRATALEDPSLCMKTWTADLFLKYSRALHLWYWRCPVLHNWRYLKSSQATAGHAWEAPILEWIFQLLFNVAGMCVHFAQA